MEKHGDLHLPPDVHRDPQEQGEVKAQLQHVVTVMSSLHHLGMKHQQKSKSENTAAGETNPAGRLRCERLFYLQRILSPTFPEVPEPRSLENRKDQPGK